MDNIKKFEKFTGEKKESDLLSLLKDVKAAVGEASAEQLEKARYHVQDIKDKVEARIKKLDEE